MLLYSAYLAIAALAFLTGLRHLATSNAAMTTERRWYKQTGAALRMLDVIMAAIVPVKYMMFPPSDPERRDLLERDANGVFRSRKKSWMKRSGGVNVKLPLQVAIVVLLELL